MNRNTYVEINLKNMEENIKRIIKKHHHYKHYIGVVKADCYGHYGNKKTIKTILNGGCDYLAVATLDEAIEIRKDNKEIPILCLGIIPLIHLDKCEKYQVTLTIPNLAYAKKLITAKDKKLKVHIKINTGMNRLGIKDKKELTETYKLLKQNKITIEGIYTHIHSPLNKESTNAQFKTFEEITSDIDLKSIPMVHIGASETTLYYDKPLYVNSCRLGIAMYGLVESKEIKFLSTFSLCSEVIEINEVENDIIGYNAAYKATGKEKIAVVAIGYADGIIRKNTGRFVYINDKKYHIVGNICMDMMFVKVDDSVNIGDKVVVIKDINHIKEIAKYLDTIPYEVICTISKRVPRIYIDEGE